MSTLGPPTVYNGDNSDDALFKTRADELYWLATAQGWYVHRPMVIGQAILRHTPTHLPEFPYKNGIIFYDFPLLPKELMSQALDFFKRIYERDHSEAEVILVHNPAATPPVKLFVPPQKCSGGSVNSAFNPEHIGKGWQIIGSIHSHCNFSAFHSGTDTGDAAEFDGLHITIGDILKPTPSYAAMVMVNKQRVDYKIETVADVSDMKADTAPAHWDRFVLTSTNTNPKIEATWEAFKAPPRHEIKYHRGDLSPKWHQAPPPQLGQGNTTKKERKRLAHIARQAVVNNGSENWRGQDFARPDSWECDQCFCRTVDHTKWDKQHCPTCRHTYGKWAKYDNDDWGDYFEEKYDIKVPRRDPDIPRDQIAFNIINEFYELFAEITELGLTASDLIPAEDLLSPQEMARIANHQATPPIKNVTPHPVAEGQVTIDDVLRSN